MVRFSWNTYIWASVWVISGGFITIQSTPIAVLFKNDVRGRSDGPVWVGAGQKPALPGQLIFLPPEGHLLGRPWQCPKHCHCCGEHGWVIVLWPFFFCCLFTVVLQVAELQAVPYVCLCWSISVFTGALKVLEEADMLPSPILPPASSSHLASFA